MGIYIYLNRYFFQTKGTIKIKEIRRLIKRLIKTDIFGPIHSPICYFKTKDLGLKKELLNNINSFNDIFNYFDKNFSNNNFDYFEIISSLNLLKNENFKNISLPITITIRKELTELGHISIILNSKNIDFNKFFLGSQEWVSKNKKNLINAIKKSHRARLGERRTELIKKINIGKDAFPFDNVKNAFFIWRNKVEDAYKDIIKFRQQLKKEFGRKKIEGLPKEERLKILKIRKEMLEPYEIYYIPKRSLDELTMNVVLKHTYIIDDFIRKEAIVEGGSYTLQTPSGSPYTLYLLLYKMNEKINDVYEKKIPTKSIMDEKMVEGFLEVFKGNLAYKEVLKKKNKEMLKIVEKQIDKEKRDIALLKDDWDGQGSKAYLIKTLEKAKKFLLSLVEDFLLLYKQEFKIPLIYPGINGDIDIEWKNKEFQLLISIPESEEELAGLYGNNYGDDEIKFDFDINLTNVRLIAWLKRQL